MKQEEQLVKPRETKFRYRLTTFIFIARLSWGDLVNPLNWGNNFSKIFPAPRKAAFKQGIANYFFRN
jgi:hypothetical protein